MFAAAPILCTVIFGDEFRDSVGMLRILVVASIGVTTIKLLGSALVARGSPGLQSLAIGAGFVCSVVLDIVLIPPFGGTGAAVAAALAHTAAGLVVAAIFIRTLGARASDLVPRAGDVAWFVGRLRERFGAGGSSRCGAADPTRAQPAAMPIPYATWKTTKAAITRGNRRHLSPVERTARTPKTRAPAR